jgi:hypothetical protein
MVYTGSSIQHWREAVEADYTTWLFFHLIICKRPLSLRSTTNRTGKDTRLRHCLILRERERLPYVGCRGYSFV